MKEILKYKQKLNPKIKILFRNSVLRNGLFVALVSDSPREYHNIP
jgi:hypothetical protein